jgi:hypothetical protein
MEQFTYVKRGYDPEEVDRYISTLEQVIKSYKEKDNAIKNAIISAQIAADNMVKNAKAQADEYKGQIAKELDKVSIEVDRQRMKMKAFQDVYTGLVRKYLTEIDEKEVTDLFERLDDVDKLIVRLKEVDIVPAPTPGDAPISASGFSSPPSSSEPVPFKPPTISSAPPVVPPTPPPPNTSGIPQISLGPSTSPSLNKNTPPPPSGYEPPTVISKINEDGNYVPS